MFIDQMNAYQDAHTRAWFTFISTTAWLAYRLDLLCVVFICFVALVSPALKSCKLLCRGTVDMWIFFLVVETGLVSQLYKVEIHRTILTKLKWI